MLRDNLAGLIEPMLSSAAAHNLGGHPERDKLGDAPGRPSWRSSLLNDPSAKFFGWKTGRQAEKQMALKVTTQAHDSRALCTAQHKSHRMIDSQCLENPRPEGAESTLTGNAASPFPAEPRHLQLLCVAVLCHLKSWDVSSANSDPPNSGNSEPSRDSRKR
jgi:hypothetical protein